MSSTPKWYCRNKSMPPIQNFAEISKLSNELRRITKRIIIDVKVDIFSEHDTILDECERVVELYWSLKDESRNKEFFSLSKKIKRSPYNALLIRKFQNIMALNDRRFCQLMFVLKRTLTYLLRKSLQSEMWLSWALQISQLYNKCRQHATDIGLNMASNTVESTNAKEKNATHQMPENKLLNANICSNMYPALLLPHKTIDFAYVLQHAAQLRIEQNSLDLMFGLFNMGEQDTWHENCESNASSLEILRILTLNINSDGEFQHYYDGERNYGSSDVLQLPIMTQQSQPLGELTAAHTDGTVKRSLCSKHTEYFLEKERVFLAQFIAKANDICPTIFGKPAKTNAEMEVYITRGIRLMWSYVGIILDHIILWWIDTPISCYSLTHIDSIRNWLHEHTEIDIPEPVYSTLRGVGEILTNFVCNNVWDQLFRLTLISAACRNVTIESAAQQYRTSPKNALGTPTGTIWLTVFSNLVNLSNSYFPHNETYSHINILPVAEQIPILHRIDHSVHSMRLWVKEQAKQLCCEWRMQRFFQILEHDVKHCLEVFTTLRLPKLTADLTDILILVCVALRTKLICEVNVNIDKLKKTTDECVQILSAVCRILSLANFKLCFPPGSHWQQHHFPHNGSNDYVGYILDHIYLPVIKSTHDIVILKLVLKIICEAWLDYIYQRRVKFSVNGALQLLNDFDSVREWILSCPLLDDEQLEKLSNHEVLRMCKGVGKILLRKPEDVISIVQTPKYDYERKGAGDAKVQETQLPSEMFVSNQKHWLQLRANKSSCPLLQFCCGDAVL